jgi:hypothetical protein
LPAGTVRLFSIFLWEGINILDPSLTPQAFANSSPGQRPGKQSEQADLNSEGVDERLAEFATDELNPTDI